MNYTNLNLPEATVKLLESKGGIKALADGDIAVENDNLEALRKVLKEAFPKDNGAASGAQYYLQCPPNTTPTGWQRSGNSNNLPSIPASILVREIEEKPFEWGERVWASMDGERWEEVIFLAYGTFTPTASINGGKEIKALARRDEIAYYYKRYQREKPKPLPLRITREMIKEKFGVTEFELVNEKG